MSKLTPLQIFSWKFTEIYTKSNHFAKRKQQQQQQQKPHGFQALIFTDPSATSEMCAGSEFSDGSVDL